MKNNAKVIKLPEIVGKGYKFFWSFKGRYRVVKGSRASKKSKTMALNLATRMMEYPDANAIVVRKVFRTLKDSCFTELKWAINRLGVQKWWDIKESPLEMTYTPTGQKIYFRGLDDPLKVTSITVEHGYLCWMWIEEAYEVMNEADFDMLDESIRGAIPPETGLFKQITLTFNPWNERHWMKKRFFDVTPSPDVLAMTTNYMCNEWLDAADFRVFETMKINNPRRYQVAGLGNWGIVGGLVYEHWREGAFTLEQVKGLISAVGLDYGYTNDPSALFVGFLDLTNKKLYVWDEMYEYGLSNKKIYDEIVKMGYVKEKITGDGASPKDNDELHGYGLNITGSLKGGGSVLNGIQWIQDLEIIVHPRCVNFLTEISNYTWKKDKFGKTINDPIGDFNHLMDAMRYALEKYIRNKKWLY